jgi:hypothetical protein
MIVDTAELFPEGKGYVMECSEIPIERSTRGTVFWDFIGKTEIEGMETSYKESFPIWLAGALFAALGFKEVGPGRYDVEPTLALGRKFTCDIVHEKIKDKPYARIKNAKPVTGGLKPEDINKEGLPF